MKKMKKYQQSVQTTKLEKKNIGTELYMCSL
jgi:hypothetical protein